ncbi:MAG: hypothetical protein LLF76_06465 [Planctomycetaceae bacterium]|nr:hypothetical protein [Planctomycetaceae bacterium]
MQSARTAIHDGKRPFVTDEVGLNNATSRAVLKQFDCFAKAVVGEIKGKLIEKGGIKR